MLEFKSLSSLIPSAFFQESGKAVFINWFDKRTKTPEEVPQFGGNVPISKEVFRKTFASAGFVDIKLSYKKNTASSEFATIIYGTARKRK